MPADGSADAAATPTPSPATRSRCQCSIADAPADPATPPAPTARSAPTAARPTPPTRCSARPAATTSPPAPCRGPRRRHPPADHGEHPACRRQHLLRRWTTRGWPSSGSTRSGTASSPAPTRSRPPARPRSYPLRHTSLLVGRESKSRDIHPDIDCGTDNGVSRRHAQLTTDGTRWWVEDLGSSNGTFVAGAVDALPKTPIDVGLKREVGPDDRIYVGSWTRLVIRKAAPGEVT